MKKYNVFKYILLALIAFGIYYTFLPALNLRSPGLWTYITFMAVAYLVLSVPSLIKEGAQTIIINNKVQIKETFKQLTKGFRVGLIILIASVVINIICGFTGLEIFNASRYASLIEMEEGNFTEDVAEISMNSIPLVDRDTAQSLGSRKIGEMSDLVSQFEVAPNYSQINYGNKPVRVTPLAYGDFFKWLNNNSKGIPAIVKVDMATQQTTLVRLSEGIKYSESDMFFRNIYRHLRFNYPTKIFESLSFEIDESGTPYWIAPTVTYRVGVWFGKDIDGAVLVNAITGEHQYYNLEDIPSWVDRVFDADLVIEQLDLNGKYSGGFWNASFGQKNVLQTTDGYNYLAINDDVYLYTGITSVGSDESNIGFVLVNLRTKQAKFYAIPGAEEYSAMSSAEGQVQNLGYRSTFPILLNVADRPSYFISLKDGAGLVKMYAFVDVQSYQIVGTGNTVAEARMNYLTKLGVSEEKGPEVTDAFEKEGIVVDVQSAVVSGNTKYYILMDDEIYIADVAIDNYLPFLKMNDKIEVECSVINGNNVVTSIKITPQLVEVEDTTEEPAEGN